MWMQGNSQNDHPYISPDAKAAEAKHQQVGLGPGPSWKRPAEGFHGACHHGNQTSAAGLQQSQERQAPFLSISQEPTAGEGGVRTVKHSEPGWVGAGRNGGHLLAQWASHKALECGTPFHACMPFFSLACPAPSLEHPWLSFMPCVLTLQAESALPSPSHPCLSCHTPSVCLIHHRTWKEGCTKNTDAESRDLSSNPSSALHTG